MVYSLDGGAVETTPAPRRRTCPAGRRFDSGTVVQIRVAIYAVVHSLILRGSTSAHLKCGENLTVEMQYARGIDSETVV